MVLSRLKVPKRTFYFLNSSGVERHGNDNHKTRFGNRQAKVEVFFSKQDNDSNTVRTNNEVSENVKIEVLTTTSAPTSPGIAEGKVN